MTLTRWRRACWWPQPFLSVPWPPFCSKTHSSSQTHTTNTFHWKILNESIFKPQKKNYNLTVTTYVISEFEFETLQISFFECNVTWNKRKTTFNIWNNNRVLFYANSVLIWIKKNVYHVIFLSAHQPTTIKDLYYLTDWGGR